MKRSRLPRRTPLKSKAPLRANREHEWRRIGHGPPSFPAFDLFECDRCGARYRSAVRESLPSGPCPGLKQNSGISRGKRIQPRNPERLHRKRGGPPGSEERHTYGAFHWWIRQQPCEVTGGRPSEHRVIDGHHLTTVERGGRDYGNEVPLTREFHVELHQIGPQAFECKYDLDLEAAAARWAERWDALSPEERAEIQEAYREWAGR